MRRPGLRTRVTAGYTAGALLLSSLMGLASYELTRRTLLGGREASAVRAAYYDAIIVQAGLNAGDPGDALRSLDTGGTRHTALRRAGLWYLRNADDGITSAIPVALQERVAAGQPSIQRVRTDNGAVLVTGVPLSGATQFYAVDSLQELERTLRVLALVLTGVAAFTTACGAALGRYVTRRAMRPLATVVDAARHITAGDLQARLDPAAEPDLRPLSTAFNQMVDQLADRLDRDRRFAADVSHELRSPLQTLAAAASVLAHRREQLDPRAGQAVDLITEEIDRFSDLVTDLIELARSDQPADRTDTDIADLARRSCQSRGLPSALVTVVAGTPASWYVDQRRFEQVLTNLLDNAERHGGGPVAVRIGQEETIRYVEVDDDGPGVPPDDRAGIFARFVRGRAAHARGDHDGTGLGLALVAQHVQAHGGTVVVTDRPGGGARFRVELPVESR